MGLRSAKASCAWLCLVGALGACDSDPSQAGSGGQGGGVAVCTYDELGLANKTRAEKILGELKQADYENNDAEWLPVFAAASMLRPTVVDSKHEQTVAMFQNKISKSALDAWETAKYPLPLAMPDGAIIVKNNYTKSSSLMARTVMVKDTSLEASTYPGQWYWIKGQPDFKPFESCEKTPAAVLAGSLKECSDCHNGVTNFGIFPDPSDPEIGGKKDAIVPYDFVNIAYCHDPATTECDSK